MDAAPVEMKVDQRTKNITRGAKRRRTHRLSRKHFAHEGPRPGAHALGQPFDAGEPLEGAVPDAVPGRAAVVGEGGRPACGLEDRHLEFAKRGLHGVALVERQRMDRLDVGLEEPRMALLADGELEDEFVDVEAREQRLAREGHHRPLPLGAHEHLGLLAARP